MTAAVLWPEREGLYSLMTLRATIGHAAFESEKQSNPVNPEACEWPDEYFTHAAFWFDQWPETIIARVLSLDPSKGGQDKTGKDKGGADYQAFCRWGADGRGVEWFEGDLCRLDIQALAERAVAHVVAFKPDVFVVEGNTFQELLGPIFTAEALRQKTTMPLEFVDNMVHKAVRIRRLTEPLAQRKGRFKARSPGTMLGVQQMRDFPTGDHDDFPDAAEMARRVGLELVSGRRRPRKPERLRA